MAMSGSHCCIKSTCSTRHENATPATRHLADRGDRDRSFSVADCELFGAQCGFATGTQHAIVNRAASVLCRTRRAGMGRSEEGRVEKECVGPYRSGLAPDHQKTNE